MAVRDETRAKRDIQAAIAITVAPVEDVALSQDAEYRDLGAPGVARCTSLGKAVGGRRSGWSLYFRRRGR